MNKQVEQIIAKFAVVLVVLAIFFGYQFLNSRNHHLNQAREFIREYKVAKALEILNTLKAKSSKTDEELGFLIFYTLVKAKKFDDAEKQLDQLEKIKKKHKENFLDAVNFLNLNNKVALINKLVSKSSGMKLSESFFIELSGARNDLNSEMSILTGGLSYLRTLKLARSKKKKTSILNKEISSSKLENYIMQRCLSNSHIFIGSKDYKSALYYLKKAVDLNVVEDNPSKDDFYYELAVTHRYLGNKDSAWENMQLAAKLGNERAKADIKAAQDRFTPAG